MWRFIMRRLAQGLVVIWGIMTVTFFLTHISGDPVALFLEPDASEEERQTMRQTLGLNEPLYVQYTKFVTRAVGGDLGQSLLHRLPAVSLILERLGATAQLSGAGLLLAVTIGVPAGIVAAVRRTSPIAPVVMAATLVGQSAPNFWLAIILMILFGVRLRWLPVSGYGTLAHLLLPATVLSFEPMARFTRLLRSQLLEVLSMDYIRTARSKGLSERVVLFKHALKNASIPLATAIGLSFGRLLGGTVIIETVYAWPGIGRLSVQAVYSRDFPLVQAAVLLTGMGFVLVNILMDMLYVYLDPRIQYS